jgi:hypothetical protein
MAPIAGLFLATFGVVLIAGGLVPRFRKGSIWAGFGLGVVAATLFGGRLLLPPPPSTVELGALALAVAAEVVAFAFP